VKNPFALTAVYDRRMFVTLCKARLRDAMKKNANLDRQAHRPEPVTATLGLRPLMRISPAG